MTFIMRSVVMYKGLNESEAWVVVRLQKDST